MRQLGFALLVGAWLAAAVSAQSYPGKPLRFVSPNPAGYNPDIVARSIGQKLAEAWGQQVIVDNPPARRRSSPPM